MRTGITHIRDLARALAPLCLIAALALTGCGPLGSLNPVEGQATVDGTPLKGGQVAFVDAASGTNNGVEIVGTIGPDGKYKMTSNGKAGVPKGKYKVTVSTGGPMGGASDPSSTDPSKMAGGPAPGGPVGIPKRQAAEKYESVTTTDLTIEVPSASYDLKLTK